MNGPTVRSREELNIVSIESKILRIMKLGMTMKRRLDWTIDAIRSGINSLITVVE